MKLFALDFGGMMVRYYIMMGLIIVPLFIGMPWLAFLALPVFLSAILGIKFFGNESKQVKNQLRHSSDLSSGNFQEAA